LLLKIREIAGRRVYKYEIMALQQKRARLAPSSPRKRLCRLSLEVRAHARLEE
jgi:hypothetical protein